MRAAIMVIAVIFSLAGLAGSAQAQDADATHAAMRKSLVYLKATGTGASGAIAGVPMEATGTGFLVSGDGFILTSYHLLSQLGDVRPETIEIWANIAEKVKVLKFKAATVNAVPENDLLLLKVPSGVDGHIPVKIGSFAESYSASQVLTSGFPSAIDYHTVNGRISSRDTGSGYLWTVDMAFAPGQSGSPVYTPDGTVIGVAKGQSINSPDINHMVPIHLADPLIGHLRIAEMQAKLSRLEKLLGEVDPKLKPVGDRLQEAEADLGTIKKYFSWSGDLVENDLKIRFQKLVGDDPLIEKVILRVTPTAYGDDDADIKIGTYRTPKKFTELAEYSKEKRVGSFDFLNFKAKLEAAYCEFGAKKIPELNVVITPYIKNEENEVALDDVKLNMQIGVRNAEKSCETDN